MTYLLLDAARMGREILTAKELNPEHGCLYKGRSEEVLADFAPYLFTIEQESAFIKWIFREGWGGSWGLFVQSAETAEVVYKHFRKFLMVKTEEGEELYFRFYDPRVLRIFLPTCDAEQLWEFFGPVEAYIMEAEDPAHYIRFTLEQGKLKTEVGKAVQFTGVVEQVTSDDH